MAGLTQYSKVVDAVCNFDRSFADYVAHVRQFLQRCADRGISSNRDKFRFGQEEVLFAGYVLSSLGYSPDPKLLSAITDFPTPESVTDLRSFLGMVTQLSAFCSDIVDCTHSLRGLLSTKTSSSGWRITMPPSLRRSKPLSHLKHLLITTRVAQLVCTLTQAAAKAWDSSSLRNNQTTRGAPRKLGHGSCSVQSQDTP